MTILMKQRKYEWILWDTTNRSIEYTTDTKLKHKFQKYIGHYIVTKMQRWIHTGQRIPTFEKSIELS